MQTIIDQQGRHIAWLNNSVEVYTPDGVPVGSVQVGHGMYSLDGAFLGYCLRGVFRGQDGRIVAHVAHPVTVPVRPELQRFLVRSPPACWPPVVAYAQEWSTDWQSVLAVPQPVGTQAN